MRCLSNHLLLKSLGKLGNFENSGEFSKIWETGRLHENSGDCMKIRETPGRVGTSDISINHRPYKPTNGLSQTCLPD